MTTSPLQVEAFQITDAPGLDPIRVYLQDLGEGRGRLTVECYGDAWANYWSAMGCSLREFILMADADYIAAAFAPAGRRPSNKRADAYLVRIIIAVKAALAFRPKGCAACDRGDFQLGHVEGCTAGKEVA